MNMADNCPFCRAKTPSSDEEHVKYLRPWAKKKKAWALALMGQHYRDGEGVKQSYEMARRLFEQAARQGYVAAMVYLGSMYYKGQGVERDIAKTRELWTKVAAHGDEKAIDGLKHLDNLGM